MNRDGCRIAVIMVNWNGARDTLAAYASLTASHHEDWRLYVVDNASTDASLETLKQGLGDRATLISSAMNAGFSGGCNIGVERALAEGATHIFLLNNDAKVLPATLSALIDASAALGDTAILGSAIKFTGTDRYQFFGSRTREDFGHPTWFDDDDLDRLSNPLIKTDFVLGAALFASALIWKDVGLFDERFYLNYEETDWCYRARAKGFDCYIVPASTVLHKAGATVGPNGAPLQTYFLYRNELLFASNHATFKQKANLYIRTITVLLKTTVKDMMKHRRLSRATRSHGIAIYDFARGRFGDCPVIIRKFAAEHARV